MATAMDYNWLAQEAAAGADGQTVDPHAHSPGPWMLRGLSVFGANESGLAVAVVNRHKPQAVADAALIAAAPDLLAALEALLAKHDDRDGASDLWPSEAAAARLAIAQATRSGGEGR
jgi:hypothetical protein